jgi:hypothetical protein
MINWMTSQIVQARLGNEELQRLDYALNTLGLQTRSNANRAGLDLLHKRARHQELAREYDEFYGAGNVAPISDLAAYGAEIAIF